LSCQNSPLLGKNTLETVTINVVISDEDALMYVALSKADKHMP